MPVILELENLRRIPFPDIEVATKSFKTKIGAGGYGPVYKGELSLSGNRVSVAVKRLNFNESGQGLKEFLTERQLLSRYKHPNLVSLLGYCEEGYEKILIYEYADRGSFDNYLDPANTKYYSSLTWNQRMNICVDAARGLDYLHNHVAADHRVIHRDIKSANILINQNWKAMIADLGLSKLGRANEKVTYLITNAAGTLGYIDPAYINEGLLTKESDVYSFGVVLFEALCGRLFFMDVPGERRLNVPLAQLCYQKGNLNVIMDLDANNAESMKEFSSVAYQCLNADQKGRPSMDVVLQKLEKALKLFEIEEASRLQELVEALVLQEILEAMEWQELQETSELQEFVEALVLQEILEAMQWQELQETSKLQEFVEALVLQEILKTMEWQELQETSKLQEFVEALVLQEILEAMEWQEFVEALVLQEILESMEWQELQETSKLQEFVEALVLQETLKAMEWQELHETSELQEFVEALVLQEILEAMEWQNTCLVAQELQETYELKEFVEALVLQEVLEAMELQDVQETCELQEFVEALVLQDVLESMEAIELGMDYGTIKAIHMISDTRRPNYTTIEEIYTKLSSGILLDDGKVWLSIDENGKNQELISAMKFMPQNFIRYAKWRLGAHSACVFSKVAVTYPASRINVEVKIIPQFLSSNVPYAAYLVCRDGHSNHENFKGLKYKLNNESRSYYSYPTYIYEHDWVMIELFQTKSLERDVEFKVLLEEFQCIASKNDVIIQGIVFLPIKKFDDEKIKTDDMENPPACETGCEKLLPGDYEQFIYYGCHSDRVMETKSQNYIIRETREEAYAILSKGVHMKLVYDVEAWFWITKSNGKKCFMLSAASIKHSDSCDEYKHSSPNESRFSGVMEIQSSVERPNMSFRIKSYLLSTNTSYACYLVYKTLSDSVNLVDVETKRFFSRSTEYIWYDEKSNHNGRLQLGTSGTIINKLPIRELPSKRKDGWLEVRLWNFTTHDYLSILKNYPQGCGKEFHIFHAGYDHAFSIRFTFKNHNQELIYSPSLRVQGLEFRPL